MRQVISPYVRGEGASILHPPSDPARRRAGQTRTETTHRTYGRKQYVKFRLPEFSNSKTIDWKFHIDETTKPDQAQYDMIIGTDLMEELGIDLSFNRKVMEWADV